MAILKKTDLKDAGPMGQAGAGIGPYDPTVPASNRSLYFKAVQKDLSKRYGRNGMKKNPPYKKGNKIAT
jgi:hypothetical protein